jgi:hypothetical protein
VLPPKPSSVVSGYVVDTVEESSLKQLQKYTQNTQPSYKTIVNLNQIPVSQEKCQGRHACIIYEKTKRSSLVVALDRLPSDLEIKWKPKLRRYANLFITRVLAMQ